MTALIGTLITKIDAIFTQIDEMSINKNDIDALNQVNSYDRKCFR